MGSSINDHANGKLLISGEYLVLAGANALALPLKFGQGLEVKEHTSGVIHWTSYNPLGAWFECDMDPIDFKIINTNKQTTAVNLQKLLMAAQKLNTTFPDRTTGSVVKITANYPLEWGLGSSSTLIYLVARWAGVEPFSLFRSVSEGSGYDVACADRTQMIFYRVEGNHPVITETQPGKALQEYAYFVSLGNKQDSGEEAKSFLNAGNYSSKDIHAISELSARICNAQTSDELSGLVIEHETILGKILKKESITVRFKNFPGTVKSLGAWGGDFAMFISGLDKKYVIRSLNEYGLRDVFRFNEIKATS
jgi:hypothetical protein